MEKTIIIGPVSGKDKELALQAIRGKANKMSRNQLVSAIQRMCRQTDKARMSDN
mgnify:CR=1 FL=1